MSEPQLSTRPSTVLDDPGSRSVARVYARAYMDAAGADGAQAAVDELAGLIAELDRTDSQTREFFFSGLVSPDHALALIDKVLAPRCSERLTSYLRVLVRHQRLGLLRASLAMAQEEIERRNGERLVQVATAQPVSEATLAAIRQSLAKSLATEPIVTTTVDPSLLGGIVIRVGDTVYDGSLRTRIKQLRARLRERCVNEIQRGRDRFSYPEGN